MQGEKKGEFSRMVHKEFLEIGYLLRKLTVVPKRDKML
jgi:hypothetical protein